METSDITASDAPYSVGTVRRDSAAGRLTLLSALRADAARNVSLPPAAAEIGQDAPSSAVPADPLDEIVGSGAEDLKRMDGRAETYFFSDLYMTRAYASYLYRLAEKDLVGLVVETVREDSRLYPRPTPLDFFRGPPFTLAQDQLDDILTRIREREDCRDIRECRASNGARYLYSTLHLTVAHAEALTEWNEVGQAENP